MPGLVTPPNGIHFTYIQAGYTHSLAFGSDGNLYSWGANDHGQLGRDTGSATYSATPDKVPLPAGVTKFTQVSGGVYYSMAMGSDGNLYSWGNNNQGELGRYPSSTEPRNRPGKVLLPAGVTKFTSFAINGWRSLAMGSDGNLYSWGYNEDGELGRETSNSMSNVMPDKVTLPAGVTRFTRFTAGNEHALAMGSD
ncbi:MAG: chromosome condensation regulator RCC1, partial [Bifidobacterium sp.]|nr:chromosome condensation regulator RCC1 [Bifidobacterium sp.]